jgi:NADH-quinone oxidoreductase subunit M
VAELLVFLGTFRAHAHSYTVGGVPLFLMLALVAIIGIVITATYVLRVLQRVFHGPMDEAKYGDIPDAHTTEWVALIVLSLLLIVIGVYPSPLTNLIGGSLGPMLP